MTRSYPAYQKSVVQWLGEVPLGWQVKPLRSQFQELKEKNDGLKNSDYLSLVAGRGVMPYAEKGDMGNKKPDDLEKCKIVKAGNFVINSMNFGIGAFGVSAYEGVCSPVYVVLEPFQPESLKFLRWIFDNREFQETAQSYGNGILAHRSAIGWDELKVMAVAVPPLPEQTAIAAFLDRETAKIDALVAEQRRLIDLLREKRQAVISHAVTKGLNPIAPLKPSGIDWLGDVPEGWEVLSLRRCSERVQTGSTPTSVTPELEQDGGFLWYTPGDFGDALDLTKSSRTVASAAAEAGEIRVFPANSVLIVSIGATLGKVGIASHPSSANQQINAVVPNAKVKPRFLAYSLVEKAAVMRFLSNASTIGIMNQERTKDIILAVPPLSEQSIIVNYLDDFTVKLDTLTASAETAINLLQERRAALISAAVTGKIDVRDNVTDGVAA